MPTTDAILSEVGVVETPRPRRGRPPKSKIAPPPIPETYGTAQYDLDRILESFLGKAEVAVMRANGSYPGVFERYKERVEAALRWEAQPTCPDCHARPGYNPLTGVWVRSWDAATHEWIEGHASNCKTLMVDPRGSRLMVR